MAFASREAAGDTPCSIHSSWGPTPCTTHRMPSRLSGSRRRAAGGELMHERQI